MKANTKYPIRFHVNALFDEVSKYFSSFDLSIIKFVSPYTVALILILIFFIRNCSNNSAKVGNEYFESGNYNIALEHYNEYLQLNPRDIKTIYNRGRCYEAIGKYKLAIHDFKQVLDIEKHNIGAVISLAQCYYKEEKYEWAANLCDQAVMLDDQNHLAHYYKGRAYHKMGDFMNAIDGYNASIGINPDFGFAYFQRSSLFLSIGLRPFGCHDLKIADSLNVIGANEAILKYCR